MIAAARLRRAEQRIEHLRPYADAIRRMTARASQAAENIPSLPILQEREQVSTVGILLVTGDRGLAGPFNSQIIRAGNRRARRAAHRGQGGALVRRRAPRRLLARVPRPRAGRRPGPASPTGPPSPTPATMADGLAAAYVDGKVDRVEIIYNGYISPVNQEVRQETLLPLQQADVLGDEDEEDERGGRSGRALARALDLRARPRGDPRAAGARLRGDLDLPGAARVDRLRARRAHERDAQRLRQRRRAASTTSRSRPTASARPRSPRRSWKSWPGPKGFART